jgi:hypothetical protein
VRFVHSVAKLKNHPKERLESSANPVLQEDRGDSREWVSEVPEELLIALNSDFSRGGILYSRGMKIRKEWGFIF